MATGGLLEFDYGTFLDQIISIHLMLSKESQISIYIIGNNVSWLNCSETAGRKTQMAT